MPDKMLRLQRESAGPKARPTVLAIAGDSAAGKTTLTRGILGALGGDRCTAVCVDDYHRYDRMERRTLPWTPLHPSCNYIGIMEQHLQLLATGQPILKPVYDHSNGMLVRPVLVEPAEYIIVEGLFPLHSKLSRACADLTVYLDPPEDIRRDWKVSRDCGERGYTEEEVLASLETREPDSEEFIRPQRGKADIVVRFSPIEGRHDPDDTPLSSTILLRPRARHRGLASIIERHEGPMHLKLLRDEDGHPVDALHVHGYAPASDTEAVKKLIWEDLDRDEPVPPMLGDLGKGRHSEPLAITQLVLLHQLLRSTA